MTMFSDTVGNIRPMYSQFCRNYMLTINVSKADAIVFRNGGIIRGIEREFFDGSRVEHATYHVLIMIEMVSCY